MVSSPLAESCRSLWDTLSYLCWNIHIHREGQNQSVVKNLLSVHWRQTLWGMSWGGIRVSSTWTLFRSSSWQRWTWQGKCDTCSFELVEFGIFHSIYINHPKGPKQSRLQCSRWSTESGLSCTLQGHRGHRILMLLLPMMFSQVALLCHWGTS